MESVGEAEVATAEPTEETEETMPAEKQKEEETAQEQEGKEEIYLFPNKIKGRGSGITILLLWYFISMEYNRKANNKS